MVGPPPGALNAVIDRAAALLATDPPGAERAARSVLAQAPTDPRAMLILASARRRQGDAQGALAPLERLASAFPRAARTRYELGLCLAAIGRNADGIAALRQAVSLDAELAEAWKALGDLLFLAGDTPGSEAAFANFSRASVRDPRLKGVAQALFAGRTNDAERAVQAHLRANPTDPEAIALLADIFVRQSRRGDAEQVLARCLELAPDFHGARFTYAQILFQRQKAPQAAPHLEQLLARDPADAASRNLLAACLSQMGDYERAGALYEGLLRDYPSQPRIWLNYGHALRTIGRQDEAIAAYKRCIALAPGLGDAYWSLANLKVASFSGDEVQAMAAQLRRPELGAEDRLHLLFARGKAMEDAGDAETSFASYAEGAALRRAQYPYSADETTALTRRLQATFTAQALAARAGAGHPSTAPIFILGLPRAGSTLVEQILASHSAMEGTMELPDIGHIAYDLDVEARRRAARYPAGATDLGPEALQALGQRYLDGTAVYRRLGRAHFIDKMPNNFQHVGLISLILPGAKIIDVRRHPMASCFSAFKQHFAEGHDFSYDLTDVGRYYRDYVDLMAHFDRVAPGRVHRVIYEDLVEDTEGQIRRLLDYCGLPFEPGCLTFYENDRAVRTVSSEQVRRPIFREGLEQWKRYEPWLEPLKAALGPALEAWRG
ncbi:sulfotransferase [Caulobacter sp. KR2-114]|uniref:sulfotransferase n=1 Tax=Caulobacter sp. KR2-114 TaxID=3400912 RepID=UPI003C036411